MSVMNVLLIALVLYLVYFFYKKARLAKTVKQYSADEAREKVKGGRESILLDVRTGNERSSGHIKGSLHIPLHEVKSRSGELAKYKEKEIICYCRSGNRSLNAASILQKSGFNAASMSGGYTSW